MIEKLQSINQSINQSRKTLTTTTTATITTVRTKPIKTIKTKRPPEHRIYYKRHHDVTIDTWKYFKNCPKKIETNTIASCGCYFHNWQSQRLRSRCFYVYRENSCRLLMDNSWHIALILTTFNRCSTEHRFAFLKHFFFECEIL